MWESKGVRISIIVTFYLSTFNYLQPKQIFTENITDQIYTKSTLIHTNYKHL